MSTPIGAIMSANIAMVQADNFMKMADAKMAAGNASQNINGKDLKNTPIWQM